MLHENKRKTFDDDEIQNTQFDDDDDETRIQLDLHFSHDILTCQNISTKTMQNGNAHEHTIKHGKKV